MADPDLMAFMRSLCTEIVAVMRAKGIPIVDEEDPFRPIVGSLTALGKNRPSMWQDLTRGKRTEVDALNGAVVEEAARLGLSAPHNAAITHFIHSRERNKFLQQGAPHLRTRHRRASRRRTRGSAAGPADRPSRSGPAAGPDGAPRKHAPPQGAGEGLLRRSRGGPAERGHLVGACSTLAPVEILRALDVAPYFPEHHAVVISAKHQSSRYLTRAGADGFSQFASSAMRADIGALLDGTSPMTAALRPQGPAPPRPRDLLLQQRPRIPALVRVLRRLLRRARARPVYAARHVGARPVRRRRLDRSGAAVHRAPGKRDAPPLDIDAPGEIVSLSAEAAGAVGPHPRTRARRRPRRSPSSIRSCTGPDRAAPRHAEAVDVLSPADRRTRAARGRRRRRRGARGATASTGTARPSGARCGRWPRMFADAAAWPSSRPRTPAPSRSPASTDTTRWPAWPRPTRASSGTGPTRSTRRGWRRASPLTAWTPSCTTTAAPRPRPDTFASGRRPACNSAPACRRYVLEADAHDPRLFSAERLQRQLAEFIERHRRAVRRPLRRR